ncbi:MAG: VPLPA-CTERM sorting domain-containing protein [Pseudomonadales bacterium]|nr:VPLPA-CTERM sorting domain-containing protein [Pseudomonadales bacterium]
MKALVISTATVVILIATTLVKASMITEIYSTTVAGIHEGDSPFLNIGDTRSFTVTYDNEGDFLGSYKDGLNGVADQGYGDDTLSSLDCIDNSISPDCIASDYHADYVFLSNATYDFSNWFTLADFGTDLIENDVYDFNFSFAFKESITGPTQFEFTGDYWGFAAATGTTDSDLIDHVRFRGLDIDNNNQVHTVFINSLSLVETDLTPVPAPAAGWLLGSALLGLFGLSRRKPIHASKKKTSLPDISCEEI